VRTRCRGAQSVLTSVVVRLPAVDLQARVSMGSEEHHYRSGRWFLETIRASQGCEP